MKVLLGVTGCISAYKACEIIRLFQKRGDEVRVVATENALNFVGEATFNALCGTETLSSVFGVKGHLIPHIELADYCDVFLIAPCSADVIAKISVGLADDLLTSSALAAWDKLFVAPSMNDKMYASPATVSNLERLRSRGVGVIEPEVGYLACGSVGRGRLAEPAEIVEAIHKAVCASDNCNNEVPGTTINKPLSGKNVLITAGPTYEKIDDVRYVANRSSGKMGFALAESAIYLGAHVTLVTGPVNLEAPTGAEIVNVESASEMLLNCKAHFENADIAVFAAAVSDFAPAEVYQGKLKKASNYEKLSSIDMKETPDILTSLSALKKPEQKIIGFAAEADNLVANAKEKLNSKNADLIVANDVSDGKVFSSDMNKACFVTHDSVIELPEMTKRQLADEIFKFICDIM